MGKYVTPAGYVTQRTYSLLGCTQVQDLYGRGRSQVYQDHIESRGQLLDEPLGSFSRGFPNMNMLEGRHIVLVYSHVRAFVGKHEVSGRLRSIIVTWDHQFKYTSRISLKAFSASHSASLSSNFRNSRNSLFSRNKSIA